MVEIRTFSHCNPIWGPVQSKQQKHFVRVLFFNKASKQSVPQLCRDNLDLHGNGARMSDLKICFHGIHSVHIHVTHRNAAQPEILRRNLNQSAPNVYM